MRVRQLRRARATRHVLRGGTAASPVYNLKRNQAGDTLINTTSLCRSGTVLAVPPLLRKAYRLARENVRWLFLGALPAFSSLKSASSSPR